MAKIKFNLNFGGETIRTLADLRENFSIEDVLDNYRNGTLARWLDSRNYADELEQVKAITATDARGILAELIRIFGVASDPAEVEADLSLVDYLEGRRKFWEDIKANGLDGMDTLRALRQELEAVKQERDELEKQMEPFNALRKRIKINKSKLDGFVWHDLSTWPKTGLPKMVSDEDILKAAKKVLGLLGVQ